MHHEKFIKFLEQLDMGDSLLEAILGGYKAVFTESMNAWAYNSPPASTGINMPMGSFQNIMKSLPSSTGAVGGAGSSDNTRAGGQNYQYNQSLPDCNRDIGDETKNQWEDPPRFKKISPNATSMASKLIKRAQETHLPKWGDNSYTPLNYYSNHPMSNSMGRFDVTAEKVPPF